MGKGIYRIFQQFIKDEKKMEIIESTQNEIEEIYMKIKNAEETNVKPLIEKTTE